MAMDTTPATPADERTQRTLADPAYRRDLGDGLLLRWSTADDVERLATFYGLVFRRKEQDPPGQRAATWTRDMLTGRDPLIGQDGFALVERTATGEVVAATCLLSEAWEYDGIRIPVGRPEIVGSLPEVRRRGLVREVFRLIHARSEAQGDLAQVITGIPWYYRQFGYEYALELENGVRVSLADIPTAKEGEPEPFTLRQAAEADLPTVARLYDEERAGALVSTPIDARYWRWAALECNPAGDSFTRIFVLEDVRGEVVGYALTGMSIWQSSLSIFALWLRGGAWLGALPAALRALRRVGEETPQAAGDEASALHALRLYLPQGHPALAALPAVVRAQPVDDPYAWYVRVADLPALLRTLAPALERRLATSPFAGYTGELLLDFYRGGLRILWREGKLAQVSDWQRPIWGKGNAGFPPGVYLQLLFGYRDLRELRHAFPDVWAKGEAKALLPTLFPRRASWALPLG
jgi:hypothetical protein